MRVFIKKAESYARSIKNVTPEVKEKMLVDKFGHVLNDETCKSIAKSF